VSISDYVVKLAAKDFKPEVRVLHLRLYRIAGRVPNYGEDCTLPTSLTTWQRCKLMVTWRVVWQL
jgi:hypothetical protein